MEKKEVETSKLFSANHHTSSCSLSIIIYKHFNSKQFTQKSLMFFFHLQTKIKDFNLTQEPEKQEKYGINNFHIALKINKNTLFFI